MDNFIKTAIVGIVFTMIPLIVSAFEKNAIAYNVIDGTNTVRVIRNNDNSYPSEVHIPEQVTYGGKTFTVVAISDWAFSKSKGGSIFYIPKTVTEIGNGAFDESTCEKVIFEQGCTITDIPYACFRNSFLEDIDIPESVSEIRAEAFYGCRYLTFIIIPPTVQTIWADSFGGCVRQTRTQYFDWPLTMVIEESPTTLILKGSGTINSRTLKLRVGRRFRAEKVVADNPQTTFHRVISVTFDGEGDPDDYTSAGYEESIIIKRRIHPKHMTKGRFNAVNKYNCKLTVPKDMVTLYEETPFWSVFHYIEGF